MEKLLDILEKENSHIRCYRTKKYSIEENTSDIIEYDDTNRKPSELKKTSFAETEQTNAPTVNISNHLIATTQGKPLFTYFLDGSRHCYMIDDILIGDKIYPLGGGEIIVGCCSRKDGKFKSEKIFQQIVISAPKNIDDKEDGEPYLRSLLDKFNYSIQKGPKALQTLGISIDKVLKYAIDGGQSNLDKKEFKSRLVAKIQNEMTDHEQIMVRELCNEGKLDDDNWLIKDGSIEYNQNFSNIENNIKSIVEKTNYKHVVGISKSFNPDLIKDYKGKKLSKTIAELKPFERTKVYRYEYQTGRGDSSYFGIWYLRLRKNSFRETNFSDIVKCEVLLDGETGKIDTEQVDLLSANIINEAYPTCYGNDTRWANHLYPVYLTEKFCKSRYRDSNIILNLF
jgi:hypothetical protein